VIPSLVGIIIGDDLPDGIGVMDGEEFGELFGE
jgi:hypothetical protein